jgi:hypothetical protein
MSIYPNICRTLDVVLSDLYDKYDRTPENSIGTRIDLDRMIKGLEAEIGERGARLLARYS